MTTQPNKIQDAPGVDVQVVFHACKNAVARKQNKLNVRALTLKLIPGAEGLIPADVNTRLGLLNDEQKERVMCLVNSDELMPLVTNAVKEVLKTNG